MLIVVLSKASDTGFGLIISKTVIIDRLYNQNQLFTRPNSKPLPFFDIKFRKITWAMALRTIVWLFLNLTNSHLIGAHHHHLNPFPLQCFLHILGQSLTQPFCLLNSYWNCLGLKYDKFTLSCVTHFKLKIVTHTSHLDFGLEMWVSKYGWIRSSDSRSVW